MISEVVLKNRSINLFVKWLLFVITNTLIGTIFNVIFWVVPMVDAATEQDGILLLIK